MPRPLLLRAAIVALLVAAALSPATAAGSIRAGRLGIGDSVMLGAKDELHARGFGVVDAVVSRQFYDAPARVQHWKRLGKLPKNVVIHLGNNGIVRASDCSHAVQAAGIHRHVFLVTLKVPRSWRSTRQPPVASLCAAFRERPSDRLVRDTAMTIPAGSPATAIT